MCENSGQGEGQGGTGHRDPEIDNGTGFEVAADHGQSGGQHSPGTRGRGEVASDDQVLPGGD